MPTCLSEEEKVKQHQGLGALLIAGGVLLATQPVWAAATQVTGVRVNPNGNGVQVLLETRDGDRPQIFMINRSNDLVADITNTQLRLPQGNTFRQDNPAPGITAVTITQMNANSIRVTVSGTNAPPKGQIVDRPGGGGIALSFNGAGGAAAAAPTQTTPTQGNSPTAQAPTAQQPTGQTPLVPNPQININGQPAPPAGTIQPVSPAPPFLPRAVAPPVGDIAVSEVDSSAASIDLGTGERIPRLLLREAPVREVLSLLSRAAGLNIVFVAPQPGPPGQQGQGQPGQPGAGPSLDATISLDIENEPLQDVFNYVLRITGLEANRNGRTIFVGSRLPQQARNVVVRTLRLNQISVVEAANFLVAQGAELQIPFTRRQIATIGTGTNAQNTVIEEPDIKLLRAQVGEGTLVLQGLSVLTPPSTSGVNSITIVGDPRKVEIATALLSQLDIRKRQVAVNVKIIDVNLLNTDLANASFSFGVGRSFFSVDNGAAFFNYGGFRPPTNAEAAGSLNSPTTIRNPFIDPPFDASAPFFDPGSFLNVPGTGSRTVVVNPFTGALETTGDGVGTFLRPIPSESGNPLRPGISEYEIARDNIVTFTRTRNTDGSETITPQTQVGTPGTITSRLPTLFQFPTRFLALLQSQITSGNAKILTDPTLTIQEGQTAQVNLTQEVYGGIRVQNQGRDREPIIKQAGLILDITVNRIDDNGFINMVVAPTVAGIGNTFSTPEDGNIVLLQQRRLNSGQIRVRDGQTLILSGIIQDSDRADVRKVPILGDIPILGALFRRTERSNARQEVIVLLTPQVMDDASGAPFGYRYRPSPDVQQMLQQRGGIPGVNNR
jgi:type IV pilus assembly protein PilQ